MSVRTLLVVFLALVCGGSAAAGVSVLVQQKAAQSAKPKTKPVLVASVDMPRGTMLKAECVETRPWPEDLVPSGTLSDIEELQDRAVVTSLVAGEPILESKLAEAGLLGAAALIEEGKRAFTISTPSPSSGVAGFLLPGNHVDILLTVKGGNTGTESARTLLQNVEIIAAGTRLNTTRDPSGKVEEVRSVTLHVTPEQAEKLTLAQSVGTLTLALRNDLDTGYADTNVISTQELMFLQDYAAVVHEEEDEEAEEVASPQRMVQPAPPARSNPPTILALRGKSATVVRFTAGGPAQ